MVLMVPLEEEPLSSLHVRKYKKESFVGLHKQHGLEILEIIENDSLGIIVSHAFELLKNLPLLRKLINFSLSILPNGLIRYLDIYCKKKGLPPKQICILSQK
jgi:hypothetical protein